MSLNLFPLDWPYCKFAKRFASIIAISSEPVELDEFHWRRKLESFGSNDRASLAVGPEGEADGIWQVETREGELR